MVDRGRSEGSENSGKGPKNKTRRPGAKGPKNRTKEGTEKQDRITFPGLLSHCRN